MKDDKDLHIKLLEVCIGKNNNDILNSIPIFLATILKDISNKDEKLPLILDEIKKYTIKEHTDYNKWIKKYIMGK